MSTNIERVIQDSTYLLEQQKSKLIEDIQDLESKQSEEDYMKFLDKALTHLLDITVEDLSASEMQQVKYALHDLGVETE